MIDLPSLPLTPGEYHMNVPVGIDPRIGGGIIDEVHHAAIRPSVPDRALSGALQPR